MGLIIVIIALGSLVAWQIKGIKEQLAPKPEPGKGIWVTQIDKGSLDKYFVPNATKESQVIRLTSQGGQITVTRSKARSAEAKGEMLYRVEMPNGVYHVF